MSHQRFASRSDLSFLFLLDDDFTFLGPICEVVVSGTRVVMSALRLEFH